MPKTKLATGRDLIEFVRTWVDTIRCGKYVACYARKDRTLILIPATSTDPLVYGYMEDLEGKDAEAFLAEHDIPHWSCATWDFNMDRVRAATAT